MVDEHRRQPAKAVDERHEFEQRRTLVASYVTGQDNPWFAKAFVNRVWYALMVKIANGRADEAGVSMARSYQDVALDAFAQDFELWH